VETGVEVYETGQEAAAVAGELFGFGQPGVTTRVLSGVERPLDYNFSGFPLGEWPAWIDLSRPYGERNVMFERFALLIRQLTGSFPTRQDAEAIAQLSPNAGIAPETTAFSTMPAEAQRQVMANRLISTYFKNYNNSVASQVESRRLYDEQKALGWCDPGNKQCRDTGTPQVYMPDLEAATMRLYTASKGVGVEGTGMVGQAGQVAHWSQCFQPGQNTVQCLEGYKDQPGAAEALQNLMQPWRATAMPGKLVQKVTGMDGVDYLVVSVGDKQWGIKLSVALTIGISTAVALGLATIGGSYYLFRTKGGKALRKRLLR
jgi:hypothetical protein